MKYLVVIVSELLLKYSQHRHRWKLRIENKTIQYIPVGCSNLLSMLCHALIAEHCIH